MDRYIWLVFVALGLLGLKELANIARSLQHIAAMTKRRLAHEGIEWEAWSEPSARVKELAFGAGTRIDAIKAYREQTGLGLKDAMAVVGQLSRQRESRA